ncbi:HdeD family acid-resistance protein [Streptosporangiaceae bacterium NEAU-GS5]|nr:HdeD family acid-resistance protein [Streptosporangiaceae bacterium NEAU-GS5]
MEAVSSTWWVIAVRGVLAILFGLMAIIWPKITVLALVILFGVYAIVNGGFALYAAFRGGGGQSRGWLAFSGIVGIVAGIVVLVWPKITTFALLLLIAIWFIVTGVMEIIAAIVLHREIDSEWMLVLSGALSVIFGLLLLIWPASGAIAIVWLIGVFAIVFGIALLYLAFRVKKLAPA